jgi:hypothetical protein
MAAQKILLQRFRTRLLSRSRIAEGTMFLQTGPEEYPEKGWKKQTRIFRLISHHRNGFCSILDSRFAQTVVQS